MPVFEAKEDRHAWSCTRHAPQAARLLITPSHRASDSTSQARLSLSRSRQTASTTPTDDALALHAPFKPSISSKILAPRKLLYSHSLLDAATSITVPLGPSPPPLLPTPAPNRKQCRPHFFVRAPRKSMLTESCTRTWLVQLFLPHMMTSNAISYYIETPLYQPRAAFSSPCHPLGQMLVLHRR